MQSQAKPNPADKDADPVLNRSMSGWAIGFGFQLLAYFLAWCFLCLNIRIAPWRYATTCWIAFNIFVALMMATSIASIFRNYDDTDRILWTMLSLFLFAAVYVGFYNYAEWLANPSTIPEKIAW